MYGSETKGTIGSFGGLTSPVIDPIAGKSFGPVPIATVVSPRSCPVNAVYTAAACALLTV